MTAITAVVLCRPKAIVILALFRLFFLLLLLLSVAES